MKVVGRPRRHYNTFAWPAQSNSALGPAPVSSPRPPELEPGLTPQGGREHMGELHHECGVAAVYHAAGRPVSTLAPIAGRRQQRGAAGPADAARHAEPRPARRRDDQLSSRPQRAAQDAQGSRHGRRGVPAQPPRRVRGDHARRGRPGRRSATSATPPAAATTGATPSRSSATTAARPSGSPSPSTASSPTTTSSRKSCSTRATTT